MANSAKYLTSHPSSGWPINPGLRLNFLKPLSAGGWHRISRFQFEARGFTLGLQNSIWGSSDQCKLLGFNLGLQGIMLNVCLCVFPPLMSSVAAGSMDGARVVEQVILAVGGRSTQAFV